MEPGGHQEGTRKNLGVNQEGTRTEPGGHQEGTRRGHGGGHVSSLGVSLGRRMVMS